MSYRKRVDIQLCYPFSKSRLDKWEPPYIVGRKLNGERARALNYDGRCLLVSSTDEIIASVPHINQAFLKLPDGEYDLELYKHGWTLSQIHSVVSRTKNLHPNFEQIEAHIFDIVNNDPQVARTTHIHNLEVTFPLIIVRHTIVNTYHGLMALYDQYIDEGYEGFVVRHYMSPYVRKRSTLVMKFKPKKKDCYEITGLYEAISEDGKPLGMVGGFNCIDDMGTKFNVGAGKMKHPERKRLWIMYLDDVSIVGNMLEIEYQTISDKNKVPLFSRAVRIL